MIEKRILDYMNSKLTEPCYLERPQNYPETFVLLERTAGSKTDLLSTATFAVQSHSGSLLEACALNDRVKAAMESAVSLTNIFSVKLNSDYNFTNQASFKDYRYQAVFFITYKE